MSLNAKLHQCQSHLQTLLQRYLPANDKDTPNTLNNAMRYACLNGGKRIRPLLVFTSAELFGPPLASHSPLAVAIELIHCYSLVHDDLPAMDNDDLRRGKPTCHKAFGEATAILAGDALLTLAFEILSSPEHFPDLSPTQLLHLINIVSRASGTSGMIFGQAMDLSNEGKHLSLDELRAMHLAKTGALIVASVQCGALVTGKASESDLASLQSFGEALGLGFQIHDDILDANGHTDAMGKGSGQDVKTNKSTFVTTLGLEAASEQALHAYQLALDALTPFGAKAETLRELTTYVFRRNS